MQLCALDTDDKLVFARQAYKHQDYACIECGHKVRVRSGLHRQAHYYHTQPNRDCMQHAKGMPHILLQEFLKNTLPVGEVELEHRFSEIGRIADVAWIPERLIFEIQCSPITASEVDARNADYASVGFQVVWILHDSRYNQTRLSAAEDVLRDWPHYFSNMNAEGEGVIYDQAALVSRGCRVHRLPRFSINPTILRKALERANIDILEQKLTPSLFQRVIKWPIGFADDFLDRCLQYDESLEMKCESMRLLESQLPGNHKNVGSQKLGQSLIFEVQRWIILPYRSVLKLLLERACK